MVSHAPFGTPQIFPLAAIGQDGRIVVAWYHTRCHLDAASRDARAHGRWDAPESGRWRWCVGREWLISAITADPSLSCSSGSLRTPAPAPHALRFRANHAPFAGYCPLDLQGGL